MTISQSRIGTIAPSVTFVSPDDAHFSASIRGLHPSRLLDRSQPVSGNDPGYSTREWRAEFRDTKRVGVGVQHTRETFSGWPA